MTAVPARVAVARHHQQSEVAASSESSFCRVVPREARRQKTTAAQNQAHSVPPASLVVSPRTLRASPSSLGAGDRLSNFQPPRTYQGAAALAAVGRSAINQAACWTVLCVAAAAAALTRQESGRHGMLVYM